MKLRYSKRSLPPVRNERGAALIVALIMLLIITVLGITATQTSLLGGKAARNERGREVAFQAAQAGLRDAINDIEKSARKAVFTRSQGLVDVGGFDAGNCTLSSNPIGAGGPGLCMNQDEASPIYLVRDLTATGANSVAIEFGKVTGAAFASRQSPGLAGNATLPARSPVYVIEQITDREVGQSDTLSAFRITVVGFGIEEGDQVLLQAVYRNLL
jgi:Tfp pilus assembly protein PilX